MLKTLKSLALGTALSLVLFTSADAADKAKYETLCNEVIQAIVAGNVTDVAPLVTKLEEATTIGIELSKEVAAADAEGKPLLDHLLANVDKIKTESLESIETNWHHGQSFKDAGIEHDKFDHYGNVINAKDSVVHPLTAIAALNEYKASGSKEVLAQAQAELEEVLGQLKQMK